MQIKDIMTPKVETIHPDSSLREAAAMMRSLDVGSVPVSQDSNLLGIITDRDIAIRAVAEGRDPSTPVRDIMTSHVICSYSDQTVDDAAQIMERHQIRRLPIIDQNQKLIGIVSLGDLAVRRGNDKLSGDVLETISEPSKPER